MRIFSLITIQILCYVNSTERSHIEYSFMDSAISGFSLIFLSEILDRTFFLNMIYGLTHSFFRTFLISSVTLLTLNLLALTLGGALPLFLFRKWIDWIAILVFFLIGIILLHDSYHYDYGSPPQQVNLSQPLIDKREESKTTASQTSVSHIDQHAFDTTWSFITSLIIAECGDKSQITSIVIGAVYDFKGVLVGTSLGFLLCIILAVWVGNFISQKVTKRQINLLSGITFTLFGISYLLQLIDVI